MKRGVHEPVVLPNYQAQLLAAEAMFPELLARMRNLAGELEAQGWQCEISDGAWVFSMPEEVKDDDGGTGPDGRGQDHAG